MPKPKYFEGFELRKGQLNPNPSKFIDDRGYHSIDKKGKHQRFNKKEYAILEKFGFEKFFDSSGFILATEQNWQKALLAAKELGAKVIE